MPRKPLNQNQVPTGARAYRFGHPHYIDSGCSDVILDSRRADKKLAGKRKLPDLFAPRVRAAPNDIMKENQGAEMSNILIRSRSGPDCKLHLEVPVGQPNTDFEVEVVFRAKGDPSEKWPAGFFDLFGSITDETFVRPPQGELPRPVELQ